jgi:hypothetical protein
MSYSTQPFEPGGTIPVSVADRLADLRPVLAGNAARGAAMRRIPDESIAALAAGTRPCALSPATPREPGSAPTRPRRPLR